MPSFVAIDVETASSNRATICQIGMARFKDGVLVDEWESLVDPEVEFSPFCIRVHGIRERDVRGSPRLKDVYQTILSRASGHVVVAHTGFDRSSLTGAFTHWQLKVPNWRWLDSAQVARHTWPEIGRKGYGLADLAARFGIEFQHHNALEDAIAAGRVLVHAINESGRDVDWWLKRLG